MESIKEIILDGLIKDLRVAERSYLLSKTIGQSISSLSDPIKIDVSQILFNLAYTDMVLGLARLYDKPHKDYPTRCLAKLYEQIENSDYEIVPTHKSDSISNLRHFGFNEGEVHLLKGSSKIDFNRRAKENFKFREYNDPLVSQIMKIKKIRDKILAHNEDARIDKLVKYETVNSLISHAKNVISFYSLTYSGIHLKNGPDFYLSHNHLDWANTYTKFSQE